MMEAVSGNAVVRVDVLGPIRVRDAEGADITPPGELPRRLLALLVLHRGRAIPAETAIEALWPTAMPADPLAALQNHVSRLRRRLPSGSITSAHDGYRLDPGVVDVDADRLAAALAADSADGVALTEIHQLLAEWHGPAYPELEEHDDGRFAAHRLDELRVRARERSAEGRLAAGTTDGLVAELQALADEHSLRERPHQLLMETLAATGRHADALRVYDDFRRLLGDELGVEPSPVFAARHAELLTRSGFDTWSPQVRLPIPATSLIGRDDVVDELGQLTEHARLLTLVGPGGVGKTRILLELGHRLAAARPDVPIAFCDLSRTDGSGTADVVARALGIDVRPGTPLADRVVGVVGDAEIVVLLDNCEHVLEPAAVFVERVLAGCPKLCIVATSRERLRVPGEQVRSVPPLAVGDASAPAVELFIERARASAGDLTLDDDVLACIEEIVARLDGIPLAIELAAARMHSHDLAEIAAGLDQPFELLSSGFRGSPRHGSLTSAVAWSYRLLDDDLQQTFADVAAFAGPFDLAGAAAVCDLDPATAEQRLTQLIERSLVMRSPRRRYRLLETLRAYGADRLVADGRDAIVARRHADHLVVWVEQTTRRLSQPGADVIPEIDEAIPELHRALTWLIDHDDPIAAGRIVAALIDYGFLRLRSDVLAWSERVIAADPGHRSPFAPKVLAAAAYAAWMAGDVSGCGNLAARALEIAERSDDVPPQAFGVNGAHQLFEGRLRESVDWYNRAADVASATSTAYELIASATAVLALGYTDDPDTSTMADDLLARVGSAATPYAAYVWYCAGEAILGIDENEARIRFERALELAETTNAAFVIGVAGASKASIDVRVGDPEDAADQYRALIQHWRRAGMWSTQWTMLRSIAALLERLGRHREAAVLVSAIHTTTAGHRLFGTDEVMLSELSERLRRTLGDTAYDEAQAAGAGLDGDAAVDYATHAL